MPTVNEERRYKMKKGKKKRRLSIEVQKSFPRFTNVTMLGTKFRKSDLLNQGDVTTVFYENDYSKFIYMKENRPIKEPRIDRLVGLLNQPRGQLNPVIINENWEIIEGQHRVKACQRLGVPVMCVMSRGAKIDDCIVMNNTGDKWSFDDYLHSHSQPTRPNHQEYVKIKKFLEEYQLNTTLVTWLLSGNSVDYGKSAFKQGTFKVKSLTYAEQQGAYFNVIKSFNTKVANQVRFGLAFVKIQKLPKFSMKTCLTQLEKYHGKFFKQSGGNKDEFIELLIKCYNYRLRPKSKHLSNKVLN